MAGSAPAPDRPPTEAQASADADPARPTEAQVEAPALPPARDEGDARGAAPSAALPRTSFLAAWNAPRLAGHFVLEDIIDADTEAALLRLLGDPRGTSPQCQPPWKLRTFNGTAYGKSWGIGTDLKARTQHLPVVPIPAALRLVVDAVRKRARHIPHVGSDWEPTEANAILYLRRLGHSLEPHADDRMLSGAAIATLSLGADCVMTFIEEKGTRTCRVPLPRRSIAFQTGQCRYQWLHSISNADLQGDTRVSVTFRRGALECKVHECWETV